MTKASDQLNRMASCYRLRLSSASDIELLGIETRRICLTVARMSAARGHVLASDVEDIAQDSVLKCLNQIRKWDPSRGAWATFITAVARNVVGDWRRRQHREAQIFTPNIEAEQNNQ